MDDVRHAFRHHDGRLTHAESLEHCGNDGLRLRIILRIVLREIFRQLSIGRTEPAGCVTHMRAHRTRSRALMMLMPTRRMKLV